MSLCDSCRSPGACCQGLILSHLFEKIRWKQDARKFVKKERYPFYPVRALQVDLDNPEMTFIHVQFDCRNLGADGRCSKYEDRPFVCSDYEPGIDGLCAEHVMKFKGIPINVIGVLQ